MTGSRLIGIVVALVVIGGVAYFVSPSFRAKASKLYSEHVGWDDEARRSDPVGFIEHSIKTLEANIGKFDGARTDLMQAKAKLDGMKQTNQEKLAFADKNLAEFKAAYKTAVGGKGWPVSLAGASYSEDDLKRQVETILSQKAGYEGIVAQADEALKTAENRQRDLVNRINESKANLEKLRTQKELVKISKLTAETEKMMAEVNQVLLENDAAAKKEAVRTVEDLMKDAAAAPARATKKADDFLNS
jgi:DNA repair exonuclease SbcCD ATPase subunit